MFDLPVLNEEKRSLRVICSKFLAADCRKLSKLQRHLETLQNELRNIEII